MTSRGVRLAPNARPDTNTATTTPMPGSGSQFTIRMVMAESEVSAITQVRMCCFSESAIQPPTSTPAVEPIM